MVQNDYSCLCNIFLSIFLFQSVLQSPLFNLFSSIFFFSIFLSESYFLHLSFSIFPLQSFFLKLSFPPYFFNVCKMFDASLSAHGLVLSKTSISILCFAFFSIKVRECGNLEIITFLLKIIISVVLKTSVNETIQINQCLRSPQ